MNILINLGRNLASKKEMICFFEIMILFFSMMILFLVAMLQNIYTMIYISVLTLILYFEGDKTSIRDQRLELTELGKIRLGLIPVDQNYLQFVDKKILQFYKPWNAVVKADHPKINILSNILLNCIFLIITNVLGSFYYISQVIHVNPIVTIFSMLFLELVMVIIYEPIITNVVIMNIFKKDYSP